MVDTIGGGPWISRLRSLVGSLDSDIWLFDLSLLRHLREINTVIKSELPEAVRAR